MVVSCRLWASTRSGSWRRLTPLGPWSTGIMGKGVGHKGWRKSEGWSLGSKGCQVKAQELPKVEPVKYSLPHHQLRVAKALSTFPYSFLSNSIIPVLTYLIFLEKIRYQSSFNVSLCIRRHEKVRKMTWRLARIISHIVCGFMIFF